MRRWVTVARATTFDELELLVRDRVLPSGTPIRVEMELIPGLHHGVFDFPGVEALFRPFIPSGTKLLDVYGEDGMAIAELEVNPGTPMSLSGGIGAIGTPKLLLLIPAIAKWGTIVGIVAGFLLKAFVVFVTILVLFRIFEALHAEGLLIPAIIIGAVIGGVLLLKGRRHRNPLLGISDGYF